MKDWPKRLAIGCIVLYRKTLSHMMIRCCRFHPTCSEYAIEAIDRYGFMVGTLKAIKRIIRCHPFSAGGYDPVA